MRIIHSRTMLVVVAAIVALVIVFWSLRATFHSVSMRIGAHDRPDSVSTLEYRVYSVVMDSLYGKRGYSIMVMDDSSNINLLSEAKWRTMRNGRWVEHDDLERLNIRDSAWFYSDHERLAKEFYSKNARHYPIDSRRISSTMPITQISDDSLKAIFSGQKDGWEQFYSLFPKAGGIIHFSRIGFNENVNEAVLCHWITRGRLNAAGYYILLRRTGSQWHIQKIVEAWAS